MKHTETKFLCATGNGDPLLVDFAASLGVGFIVANNSSILDQEQVESLRGQLNDWLNERAAKPQRRHTMHNPAFAAPYGNGVRPKTLDQLFTASGQTLDDVAAEATRRKPGESDAAFRSRIQRAVQAADYNKMAAHWDPATGTAKPIPGLPSAFFEMQAGSAVDGGRAGLVQQLLNACKSFSREYLEFQTNKELVEIAKAQRLAPGPWLKLV